MNHLVILVRVAAGSGLLLALASACGGRSFNGDGDGDGGKSQAGAVSSAGKGQAASGNGGATSHAGNGSGNASGSGTTGGSGYGGEACTAPPVSGNCEAYFRSWYHDPSSGICRPFVYGGCGGNANRYDSLAECQSKCSGGSPNYDRCQVPTDCIVVGNGCCGVCDGPNVDAHDLIAYNRKYQSQLVCGTIPPELPGPGDAAPGVDLPACAPCPPVAEGALRYFVPDCVQGQCTITDLRESALTACKTNGECRLRYGTRCCESCQSADLIALRTDASLEKFVCGGDDGCPDCVPQPTDQVAICTAEGRCEVGWPIRTD